jgi:hypothetical protein
VQHDGWLAPLVMAGLVLSVMPGLVPGIHVLAV